VLQYGSTFVLGGFVRVWAGRGLASFDLVVFAGLWIYQLTFTSVFLRSAMKLYSPLLPYLALASLFFTACDSKKHAAGDSSGVFVHLDTTSPEDEFAQLRRAAEQGDSIAQFNLGDCYRDGSRVAKDRTEAIKWYRKGAEQGNAGAQRRLGDCYRDGLGVAKDSTEAVKWYRKAAEEGNADAQRRLGWCYQYGVGVAKDVAKAVKWYHGAAKQGNADAQYRLGWCYKNGLGVAKDEMEAVQWYRKAAEQENAAAQFDLGDCYFDGLGVTKDRDEAVKWYRKSAELEYAAAQYSLGWCYQNGSGVAQDGMEAVKWYRKAAEQGDVDGQLNLGNCYFDGFGVGINEIVAVKWYRKAAEQKSADAQRRLGDCYRDGLGVIQDRAIAMKLYSKAAEQGNVDAQHRLRDAKKATETIERYGKAAEQGDAEAQLKLGDWYRDGSGVAKNRDEAVKWYLKAAEQGNAEAQCRLGSCYSQGDGVVKNEVEAYKWMLLSAAQGWQMAKENAAILVRDLSPAQRAEGLRLVQVWEDRLNGRSTAQEPVSPQPAKVISGEPKVSGTGFLITLDGYLVTNYHVVKDCRKVQILTAAGFLAAEIVRVDDVLDLALLKVEGPFAALPVVSSGTVRLGMTVATVGFPNIDLQGFAPKLSKGEISSLSGAQDDSKQFQISVPVQPGNSGGALVDEHGNVVGVVSAQLSQKAALQSSGTLAQNVNYAVKSSYVLSFLEAIPAVSSGLLAGRTEEQKFESVVDDVKSATVLIIGY
jgi:TPR repeat protein